MGIKRILSPGDGASGSAGSVGLAPSNLVRTSRLIQPLSDDVFVSCSMFNMLKISAMKMYESFLLCLVVVENKQALRSKFLETAKGWYLQTL